MEQQRATRIFMFAIAATCYVLMGAAQAEES